MLIGDADHDAGIGDDFHRLRDTLHDNPDCHLEIGYSEALAHLVYAGADRPRKSCDSDCPKGLWENQDER
ncbi:MAG TPA: hypothetical protein VGM53_07800 [Streptosporangiaceae bacterium]